MMRNDDPFDVSIFVNDFGNCVPKCSESQMNTAFLKQLEEAYHVYPFRLTSAYRSPEWERKHGRAGTSAHTLGRAVDIATPDSRTRYYVLLALLRVGFSRFGIGKAFIHVDNDASMERRRPDRCIFLELDK